MPIPTQVTFQELDRTEALEAHVLHWVERCEQVHDRIEKCEVTISQPHRSHSNGRAFQVSLRLAIPGNDITVTHMMHQDVYVAVADAFRAARRQADERIDMQRGFVKRHATG